MHLRLLFLLGWVRALSPQHARIPSAKRIHAAPTAYSWARGLAPALLAGLLAASAVPPAFAIDPSPAALTLVQQALESSSQQKPDAVSLLDKVIGTWKKEKLPDDELAGLYRLRADARNRLGAPDKAEADLTEVVQLLRGPGAAAADPSELPRALLFRARLESARSAWSAARGDASAALALDDDLPPLEQRNPFAYELLGRASLRDGDFAAAAAAFGDAEKAHDRVGDAIRARNAEADEALALPRRDASLLKKAIPARTTPMTSLSCRSSRARTPSSTSRSARSSRRKATRRTPPRCGRRAASVYKRTSTTRRRES